PGRQAFQPRGQPAGGVEQLGDGEPALERADDDAVAHAGRGHLQEHLHVHGYCVPSSMASTSPHSNAVSALIASPLTASHPARSRPIRRGRLTVPPAPGTRPMATSGRRNVVSGRAMTRPANAGNSVPAPTHAPCTTNVTRSQIGR